VPRLCERAVHPRSNYQGQCRACQNRNRRKIGTQSHKSGATILYDERHPRNPGKIRFLCPTCCPNCNRKHYVNIGSIDNPAWEWSGRCNECKLGERFKVIELPSGGTIRRDPQKSTHGWVTCPDGKEERYINLPTREEIEFGKFTGLCSCHAAARKKKLTGTKQHRSGATILYDEPDLERPHLERSAFLCANPDNDPECLVKSYAWFNQFHDPTWRGLCQNCLSKQPSPRKIIEDLFLHDGPDGKSTAIHYSRREEPGRVSVTYWRCGHTVTIGREAVSAKLRAHRAGKRPWPSICYPCALNPEALLQSTTVNGNGQKNGGAVNKQRGGARNVKWPPALCARYLAIYEEVHPKVKRRDPSLPEDVLNEALLRGNKPSEVARDYAARLMGVNPGDYLQRVLAKARQEKPNV
jgi:hypothetical protein